MVLRILQRSKDKVFVNKPRSFRMYESCYDGSYSYANGFTRCSWFALMLFSFLYGSIFKCTQLFRIGSIVRYELFVKLAIEQRVIT